MQTTRIQKLKAGTAGPGLVAYWMSRDQRVNDNWALLFARELAILNSAPLVVIFCLAPAFLGATIRHYSFLIGGIRGVADALRKKNIAFILLAGNPSEEIPRWINLQGVSSLVTDFDPIRIKREWKDAVAKKIGIPFYEVDAHNIVPCWAVSQKQEYGAYTLRPKIQRLLAEYMVDFPPLKPHPVQWNGKPPSIDWNKIYQSLPVDRSVPEVNWIEPGEQKARETLDQFLNERLRNYDKNRNDPTLNGQSCLSPYLHFGHISAQRVALETEKAVAGREVKRVFLEELIVRRELSDNFCFYNPQYDKIEGFPGWAKQTLDKHRGDRREYLYTIDQFECAESHDPLWNAAQMEMVKRGKAHGYMRMYWAKKILEWTASPEDALEIAIQLNDRYELDGRDPNGYTGIAWSIGGVHDRAWGERPVFGKIRYMSYNGCKTKFDIKKYIAYVNGM